MIFSVNLAKKNEIAKRTEKTKTVLFLKKIEISILAVFVILVLLHIVKIYKNYSLQLYSITEVFISLISFLAIGGFLLLIINRLAFNLSGKDIYERKDEELIISEKHVLYVFRLKNQNINNRYVITLKKSPENKIQIDNENLKNYINRAVHMSNYRNVRN